MNIDSKARAARRRRERYAARGLPDPARLYELNCQRKLPKDHPSYDPDDDTGRRHDTGEKGTDRREPIITTPAQARRMYQYVGVTGVCRRIDEVLRAHRGEQPVLTTHMLLTVMLLAVKREGRYMRSVSTEVAAGLDAAVAIEWGLLDPDTGESGLSYNLVERQTKRLETFVEGGAVTPSGTRIDLQWMVDRFLAPSIPKWIAPSITEIAVDATDYETNARTIDYTPQAEVDAGTNTPRNHPQTQRQDTTHPGQRRRRRPSHRNVQTPGREVQRLLRALGRSHTPHPQRKTARGGHPTHTRHGLRSSRRRSRTYRIPGSHRSETSSTEAQSRESRPALHPQEQNLRPDPYTNKAGRSS